MQRKKNTFNREEQSISIEDFKIKSCCIIY